MDLNIKGILKKDKLESQEVQYVLNNKEVFRVISEEKKEIEVPKIIARKGLIKDNTPIEIVLNIEIEKDLKDMKKEEGKKNYLHIIKEDSFIKEKEKNKKSNILEELKLLNEEKEKKMVRMEEKQISEKNKDSKANDLSDDAINRFLHKIKELEKKIKEELRK